MEAFVVSFTRKWNVFSKIGLHKYIQKYFSPNDALLLQGSNFRISRRNQKVLGYK